MGKFIDTKFGLNPVSWLILEKASEKTSSEKYTKLLRDFDVRTAPFFNGRERGFVISVKHVVNKPGDNLQSNVFFAESRSSDDVVVYSWVDHSRVNPPVTHEMPDAVWKKRRTFDLHEDAVNYILFVIDGVIEEQKKLMEVKKVHDE